MSRLMNSDRPLDPRAARKARLAIAAVSLVLAATLAMAGCSFGAHDPANASRAPYLQSGGLEAADPSAGTGTAVDDALLWARKCAESLETLDQERQKNAKLSEDNQKLAGQVTKTQGDLTRAQAELAEANKLLVDVRQEVQKWKTDVLGFRDEIRKANQAQLEALAKVLTLVGAEVPNEPKAAAEGAPASDKPTTAPAPAAASDSPPTAGSKASVEPKAAATASASAARTTSPRTAAGKGK